MMDELKRPDPDKLLAAIKKEEEKQEKRGKLKIFLGYVAGVGKTYAMLEAAHQRVQEGVDVVAAYIETHGRKDTEAMFKGLEVIPQRQINYHHVSIKEMDINAVLRRHPQLALVDELAHTNAHGCRHPKRYQDVMELLSAGIDVYTTVNIQHLESLKDVIQRITGVTVRESVPDSLVDEAYEIELIDLPTDELLKRLKDGKVYVPESAAQAFEKFFRKGNLTALRELTMRKAADRVDDQMLDYMQAKNIEGPWAAGEHILVCISYHPMAERLIRAGRRLADDLNAEWSVIHVEIPQNLKNKEGNLEQLQQNFKLAEKLGASIYEVPANSAAEGILDFAHSHNITKILVGKAIQSRLNELLHGSDVDKIIRSSGSIDVYVVSDDINSPKKIKQSRITPHHPWNRYLISAGLVVLATLIGSPLQVVFEPTNLVMLYLVAVVLAATFLGRGPSILASVLSVLAFDFFLVQPVFSFSVYDTQYLITFIGLLLVGLVISNSAALLRDQVDALKNHDQHQQAINDISRELTSAFGLETVLNIVIKNIHNAFDRDVVVFLPEEMKLIKRACTPNFFINENDLAIAEWSFTNAKPAGSETDTLPASLIRFQPLVTSRGIIGILGISSAPSQKIFTFNERTLLESFANLSALAIERALFAEQVSQNEMMRRSEQLQSALLNSISHELRTPLATITGVLSSLDESAKARNRSEKLNERTKVELIQSAIQQANELNHIVENLLDMTRIEAGKVQLNCSPEDIQDLIGSVLRKMADRLNDHPVKVKILAELPLIRMDSSLIATVLTNILDNAGKFSPRGKSIIVSVTSEEKKAVIAVEDHGIGIPKDDLKKIFDKFYRVQNKNLLPGTGLGLAICKGIIEAHGGLIWAESNQGKGTTFKFTLPI
jgi:two-component system sensor histidine kinase KdpD